MFPDYFFTYNLNITVTFNPIKIRVVIESFIYPTDAQLDYSKNVKIYMRGALTCFSFPQPSSGCYYMYFAKVISINNQLKYVILLTLITSAKHVQ